MKSILTFTILALGISPSLLVGQTKQPENAKAPKAQDSSDSQQIRVYIETFEISALEYADIMTTPSNNANQNKLRNDILAKAKAGKATLLKNHSLITTSGERAVIESVKECIYPTEYDPPELPYDSKEKKSLPGDATPPNPTAFETRNTGDTIELEATIQKNNKTISLNFKPESVTFTGNKIFSEWEYKKIKTKVTLPKFYTKRSDQTLSLQDGEFLLANTFSPKHPTEMKPDHSRKILTFIRAEILKPNK